MAFVKLPDDIRFFDAGAGVPGARGRLRAEPIEFAVFAGSAAANAAAGAKRVDLVSPWGAESFAGADAPIALNAGDVGAVMALIPPGADSGPIIASANLDRDERADLLSREADIAQALGLAGPRGWSARLGAAVGAAIHAAAAACAAFVVASLFLAQPADAASALAALERSLATPPAAALAAAGLAAAFALAGLLIRGAIRARAHARLRRAALDRIWDNAADAMAFVQAHRDMFRSAPSAEDPATRRARVSAAADDARRADQETPAGSFERPLVDARRAVQAEGAVALPAFLKS